MTNLDASRASVASRRSPSNTNEALLRVCAAVRCVRAVSLAALACNKARVRVKRRNDDVSHRRYVTSDSVMIVSMSSYHKYHS